MIVQIDQASISAGSNPLIEAIRKAVPDGCPTLWGNSVVLIYYPDPIGEYERYLLPADCDPQKIEAPCAVDLGQPTDRWRRRAGEAPGIVHPAACHQRERRPVA